MISFFFLLIFHCSKLHFLLITLIYRIIFNIVKLEWWYVEEGECMTKMCGFFKNNVAYVYDRSCVIDVGIFSVITIVVVIFCKENGL